MRIFVLILLIVISLNTAKSQLQGQAKIDSLLKELPKMKEDTNGVNLLVSLSFNYRGINPDEGIKYGEQALKIAVKIKWELGRANSLSNIGILYHYKSDYSKALEHYLKALKIYEEFGNKTGIARNLVNIGSIYLGQADYPKALEYYLKALKFDEGLGNKKGIAGTLNNIGLIHMNQSNYPKALEYFHKALKINEEINNKNWIAINFVNIGHIYNKTSNYSKALEYFHKALKINEALGEKSGIATNLGNIGSIYRYQSNFPKALEYHLRALKINEELGNRSGVASAFGSIGSIYVEQSDYPKALEYHLNALKIDEELGNKSGIASTLGSIGDIYWYQSNNEKALEYSYKALKIYEDIGNNAGISSILASIGNIYRAQSDYPKALEYYLKALKINENLDNKSEIAYNLGYMGELYYNLSQDTVLSKINENTVFAGLNKELNLNRAIEYSLESIKIFEEIGEVNPISRNYKILSFAYTEKGDYKKAFEAFKEHKQLQDSIFSMDKQKEIANLEAKRENELKDAEIVILQTEKKAQKYLFGSGIIISLILFVIAFIRFREKKKLSEKLALQNAEIETQKGIVEEKNEQILASITYASTIQHAILPWESTLAKAFGDIFIFFKPKDIVSGDSYWFQEIDGIKFLAVIDCTGHGIPGSMLTVIASSVLDDAVLSIKLHDTAQILTFMNDKVTEVLNQRLSENQIRDGMEVALIAIHQNKIQFSGAGRPLYMKNGTFEIIKTDKRGIAGQVENDVYDFSSVEIGKSENITLYLTTDGFADQMNEDGKKYSTKRFVSLLESISEKPITEQNKILETEFNSHKGNREQIDDVTVLGVKI